jgi:hypothetical protein
MNQPGLDTASQERGIATHGMVFLDVIKILVVRANTGVPSVEPKYTPPNNATLLSSLLFVNTPFIASA